MVDTGLSSELITPHLRSLLAIPASRQRLEAGYTAGGRVQGAELVSLQGEGEGEGVPGPGGALKKVAGLQEGGGRGREGARRWLGAPVAGEAGSTAAGPFPLWAWLPLALR